VTNENHDEISVAQFQRPMMRFQQIPGLKSSEDASNPAKSAHSCKCTPYGGECANLQSIENGDLVNRSFYEISLDFLTFHAYSLF
jgi:hypothetical protein